jgi:RimJ/RimL family protein N-acetyltransferase
MHVEPVTLEGAQVRLEPLALERHWDGLRAVGLDPGLWRWSSVRVASEADLRRYLETALEEQAQGQALPFATVARASGEVAGSTRFLAISEQHRRVEIGWTWIAVPWRRTAVNTEAKYLMLRHAFETWGCQRVQFNADARNQRSRQAILRLGAREEGTARKHMINADGSVRSTVWFGIVDDEWPAVKARLEEMMRRHDPAAAPPGLVRDHGGSTR